MKGKSDLGIVGLVILGILAWALFSGKFSGQPESVVPTVTEVTSKLCGDDGQADLELKYRNIESTSTDDYSSVRLTLVDSAGNVKSTYGTNTDGTYASTANVLECGKSYKVIVLNNASISAKASDLKVIDSSKVQYDILGRNSTDLTFKVYTLAYANETIDFVQDATTTTNNAMGTGDSLDMRFDIKTNTGTASFGSEDYICETDTGVCGRAFVCADFNLAKYAKGDITLVYSGVIKELPILPKFCSANAYEKAWEVKSLPAGDGTLSGQTGVKASVGAPADGDNVKFIWVDNNYYTGSGKVKIGTADDTNTDTGETNRAFTENIT